MSGVLIRHSVKTPASRPGLLCTHLPVLNGAVRARMCCCLYERSAGLLLLAPSVYGGH